MKKTVLLTAVCLLLIGCETSTRKTGITTTVPNKISLWTIEQRESFINKNAKCSIDTMLLQKVIDTYELEKNDSVLQAFVKSPEYEKEKKSIAKQITIDIDAIAAKNPEEIELILGKYTKEEVVNPSRVGQCPKNTYLGGLVEIVYIDDKADWITINNGPYAANTKDVSMYLSVQRFSDYTYVKVKTD